MSEVTVEDLEHQKEEAKLVLSRFDRIEKLLKNPDFKAVIIDHWGRDDAARYVQESMDPALDASQKADSLAMAQAPGHLKRWFNAQFQMANYHRKNMVSLDETIEEIRREEASAD